MGSSSSCTLTEDDILDSNEEDVRRFVRWLNTQSHLKIEEERMTVPQILEELIWRGVVKGDRGRMY